MMNQYKKRIHNLEQRKLERMQTPVVIADLKVSGEYEYNGEVYSKEEFDELMKKFKPNTIILDDIPRE